MNVAAMLIFKYDFYSNDQPIRRYVGDVSEFLPIILRSICLLATTMQPRDLVGTALWRP